MKALKEYKIPFIGLKLGKHLFEYRLGKKFFDAFDYSEIDEAEIQVKVELEKQASMLIVNTEIHGAVHVPCDRCGDPVDQKISGHFNLIVKFGQETGDTIEDVLILGPQEFELELAQFFYEYTHLSLPARRTHVDIDSCNQEVLKQLEKYSVGSNAESNWIDIKDMHREDPGAWEEYTEEEE